MRFVAALTIGPRSWLQDARYAWFRKAHQYASCKTNAIAGLATIAPEDLYHVFTFMLRDLGGEVVDGKLVVTEPTDSDSPAAQPDESGRPSS